jgi:hypothetical protein
LAPTFWDLLTALQNMSGQTETQQKAVTSNITWMDLLIRTLKVEHFFMKIESTLSEDWRNGLVEHVITLLDTMFCQKDTMAKAQQKRRLGELTLKDCKYPDNFNMKIARIKLKFNNILRKEDMIAT